MNENNLPVAAQLADLVRRILKAVEAQRIVLFGSAARGEMTPDSDLDILVVVRDGTHPGHASDAIYDNMWGFGLPKDIVVVTESDVRRFGANPYLIIHTALNNGRELYRAAS